MPMLPYFAFLFLLLAAAVLSRILAGRHSLAPLLGPAAIGLAGIAWLLAAPDDPANVLLAGWSWLVDEAAWQLTGIALLLALAGALSTAIAVWREDKQRQAPAAAPSTATILAMTAAALPVLWAGDVRTMVAGYALLLGVWLLAARAELVVARTSVRSWTGAAVLALPLPLLWLAASLSSRPSSGGWVALALLGAGLVAVGAFPGGAWRRALVTQPPQTAALLAGLPVLAAGKFLLPLAQLGALSGTVLAVGTIAGLVALLMAVRVLFSSEISAGGLALSAAAALGGLVLLAVLWAGPDGLLAQVRVAALAPAILFLIAAVDANGEAAAQANIAARRFTPFLVASGIALAALAAVPLTAGFRGLGGVYETWLGAGGWPLLLVAALLMTLLILALVARGRLVLGALRMTSGRYGWLAAAPAMLLGAGLLAVPWPWLGELSPVVWVAILLPLVAGVVAAVLLGRRGVGAELLATTIPTLPAMWRESRAAGPVAVAGRLAADATADALAILEGPYGLLWVLALLALLAVLA